MYNTNDIQYAHHCLPWGCKKTFGDAPLNPLENLTLLGMNQHQPVRLPKY